MYLDSPWNFYCPVLNLHWEDRNHSGTSDENNIKSSIYLPEDFYALQHISPHITSINILKFIKSQNIVLLQAFLM